MNTYELVRTSDLMPSGSAGPLSMPGSFLLGLMLAATFLMSSTVY